MEMINAHSRDEDPIYSVVFRIDKTPEKTYVSLVDFGEPKKMSDLYWKMLESRDTEEALDRVNYKLVPVTGWVLPPEVINRNLYDYTIQYLTDDNGEPWAVTGLSQFEMVEAGSDDAGFYMFKNEISREKGSNQETHHIATFKRKSDVEIPEMAVVFRSIYKDMEFVSLTPVYIGEISTARQVCQVLTDETRDLPGRDGVNILYWVVSCIDDHKVENYSRLITPSICRNIRPDRVYAVVYNVDADYRPSRVFRIDDVTDLPDLSVKTIESYLDQYIDYQLLGYRGKHRHTAKERIDKYSYLFDVYTRGGDSDMSQIGVLFYLDKTESDMFEAKPVDVGDLDRLTKDAFELNKEIADDPRIFYEVVVAENPIWGFSISGSVVQIAYRVDSNGRPLSIVGISKDEDVPRYGDTSIWEMIANIEPADVPDITITGSTLKVDRIRLSPGTTIYHTI